MKAKLPFLNVLAVFFLLANTSFSQVNSYLENNPIWGFSTICLIYDGCTKVESYNYYINGDSIIGSFLYKKIYKKGEGYYTTSDWQNPNCEGPYSYIQEEPSFFLRSEGKKMFIVEPEDTAQFLFYDFNLSVGDYVPLSYTNYEDDVLVTAIDSFYTPYGYRNRFTLGNSSQNTSLYLIEGVGHSEGFIQPIQTVFECSFWFDCFSLNDTTYFPELALTCNIAVGLPENNVSKNIYVYPNPVKDILNVQANSLALESTILTIHNSYGKVILITKINNSLTEIDMATFANGIYFLTVENGTTRSTQKIIKISQ